MNYKQLHPGIHLYSPISFSTTIIVRPRAPPNVFSRPLHHEQYVTQGQILKIFWIQSFSFSLTRCLTIYPQLQVGRTDTLIPFASALARIKTQLASSGIWSRAADFISFDERLETKCSYSSKCIVCNIPLKYWPLFVAKDNIRCMWSMYKWYSPFFINQCMYWCVFVIIYWI